MCQPQVGMIEASSVGLVFLSVNSLFARLIPAQAKLCRNSGEIKPVNGLGSPFYCTC
jgi:hypothetical protein